MRLSARELVNNFPLYAATCLKIVPKGQPLQPLILNYSQKVVERTIREMREQGLPPRIIELKARQTGLSTDAEGRMIHMCHLRDHTQALVIAHTLPSARRIFNMARRYVKNLPKSIYSGHAYFTKNEIEFVNGSRFEVEVATEGSGRGSTATGVHLSEFAFYPNASDTLIAVMNAVPDTTGSLVIVESSPKGMNDFHDLYVTAKKPGAHGFRAVFIPWFDETGYQMRQLFGESEMDEEERELKAKHGLTMEQLSWRRYAIRTKCNNSVEIFRQEYPSDDVSCFIASMRRVFDFDAIQHYSYQAPPHVPWEDLPPAMEIDWDELAQRPVLRQVFDGRLRIYKMPEARHLYIVGADPSEGDSGSDPSPVVVMDRMTLEPVAVWHGRLRADRLAHVSRNLCALYNDALGIWEANNHGSTFMVEFEKIWNHFYFRETTQDSVAKKISSKPGYMTTIRTKHHLWNGLRTVINDLRPVIRDPNLIGEMAVAIYDERDIPGHEDRSHDDTLVAYGLCIEAHRDGEDNVIAPLSDEDLRSAVLEARRRAVAQSMGIDAGPLPEELSRHQLTAHDLEEMDEADYRAAQRRAGAEIGDPL